MPGRHLPVGVYEKHYLASDDPRAQSGFRGDEARWALHRRPILAAIDRDGSLLDVGCANGHLLESLVAWSPHRLEPYGLDFSSRLVALARDRLPHWRDRFFFGDVLEWTPPQRFDFVRTELVYVPPERRRELVERVLAYTSRLVVCGYGSVRRDDPAEDVGALLRSWGYVVVGESEAQEDGFLVTRVAWIEG